MEVEGAPGRVRQGTRAEPLGIPDFLVGSRAADCEALVVLAVASERTLRESRLRLAVVVLVLACVFTGGVTAGPRPEHEGQKKGDGCERGRHTSL